VGGETPGSVHDDAHGQADLTGRDGVLQLTIAHLHDLACDAMNTHVGIAGAGPQRRGQGGVGQGVPRQRQEIRVDTSGSHGFQP
jgi:hypothetical protein